MAADLTYIYALQDPRTYRVRYIGKSDQPGVRLKHHLRDPKGGQHKRNWLATLTELGLMPRLMLVEQIPRAIWQERERFWVTLFRDLGETLTNQDDGGSCPPSHKGRPKSEEHRRKIAEAHRGKPKGPMSAEHKAAIGAANKGRCPAGQKRSAESRIGTKASPDLRLKLSLAHRAQPVSEEMMEKLRRRFGVST